jgi:hypothetical protein
MDADNFERNKGRTFAKYWQSVTYILKLANPMRGIQISLTEQYATVMSENRFSLINILHSYRQLWTLQDPVLNVFIDFSKSFMI